MRSSLKNKEKPLTSESPSNCPTFSCKIRMYDGILLVHNLFQFLQLKKNIIMPVLSREI